MIIHTKKFVLFCLNMAVCIRIEEDQRLISQLHELLKFFICSNVVIRMLELLKDQLPNENLEL